MLKEKKRKTLKNKMTYLKFLLAGFVLLLVQSLFAHEDNRTPLKSETQGAFTLITTSSDTPIESPELQALKRLISFLAQENSMDKAALYVLAVGCSFGDELLMLQRCFGEKSIINSCDIDTEALELAKEKTRDFPNIAIQSLDFSDRSKISYEPQDIIFLRHPEPFGSDDSSMQKTWFRIFRNAKRLLKEGGLLIVTSYFRAEMEFFELANTKVLFPLKLLQKGVNPCFVSTRYKRKTSREHEDYGHYGSDLFLIVFKKVTPP